MEFSGFDGVPRKASSRRIRKPSIRPYQTLRPRGQPYERHERTVKFTSNEAGYYTTVWSTITQPNRRLIRVEQERACTTSETTISLTALTAGAMDIYIKAKDSSGNVSSVLKIDVPAYTASSGRFTHSSSSSDEGAPVIVNGTTYSAGDAEDSTETAKP